MIALETVVLDLALLKPVNKQQNSVSGVTTSRFPATNKMTTPRRDFARQFT